jgi:transposase
MIIIRMRLPPGFPTNCVCGYRNWGVRRTAIGAPRGGGKVLFYRDLGAQGAALRLGMEASGHARWFARLLGELRFELWIGDAAEIRTKRVRKQKTDRQDAELILQLLLEDRFPQIWVPSGENRDLRQLSRSFVSAAGGTHRV